MEAVMKIRWIPMIAVFVLSAQLAAQSLFESATTEDKENPYDLNGYVRATLYLGESSEGNDNDISSAYGEAAMKFSIHKQDFGDAFAEIRFRRGNEFQKELSKVDLREAYVNAYVGKFDLKIGHQIVVWGRADSLNPTNNLTPETILYRSPDEDDRRLANFLIRSYYNAHPVRIEAVWVPVYRASYVPLDLLILPPGVIRGEEDYPGPALDNGAYALRLNLEFPSFDGSLSYFNGYNPRPGISTDSLNEFPPKDPFAIIPKAYRMSVIGADAKTTAGAFGLRGEVAYRKPQGDYKAEFHIPNPDLCYVFGIDREFSGNLSIIVQYAGKYVFDFEELYSIAVPDILPIKILLEKNRMIAGQQNELSHSFSCRAGLHLLHETLELEVVTFYNLTTEEYFFTPKMDYDIADALTFTLGAILYGGPDNTLFGTIDKPLSAAFTELRLSF
jgi:hypothetical protein